VSTHAGLRDRALIWLMVYSFARVGAALGMAVEAVYPQNRRLWVRLREKGGKRHASRLGTSEAKEWLEKAISAAPAAFNMYVRSRVPWFRPEDHAHLVEGLRKAGWEG
jgi:integrase